VRVVAHGVVGSTMDVARDDPGGAPVVHLAAVQTAGRGRRGRPWESPPGNLYATIAWPDPGGTWPPAVLAAVQLAWAEALEAAGFPAARVKWPNDGWIAGRKWSGVVAERAGARLLLGLGANLARAPAGATALAEHWRPWPGAEAASELLLQAAIAVLRAGPGEFPARLARWPARDALEPGEPLVVEAPGGPVEGRYAGVAPDGRLRLAGAAGERLFAVGDAVGLRSRRDGGGHVCSPG
jgi:BirA family biotin operon repressor/biotin-[acetyl-CoA-carboxylase] ligase